MWKRLHTWLKPKTVELSNRQALDELNKLSPLIDAHSQSDLLEREAAESLAQQSLICREAVLNREQRIVGYEFMLRKSITDRIRHVGQSTQRLYDQALVSNLVSIGLERLIGHRWAFLSITPGALFERDLDHLSPQHIVLMLDTGHDGPPTGAMLQRIEALQAKGVSFGLDWVAALTSEWSAILPWCDFLLVDISVLPFGQLDPALLHLFELKPGLQALARNIVSEDEFAACYGSSPTTQRFQYFQGPFITARESWQTRPVEASKMRLIELLNRIRLERENSALLDLLKSDSILLLKLLRYVNSPAGGLRTKVTTVEHALLAIGREKLYRWLTLLLYSTGDQSPLDLVVLDTALIRARLVETIGTRKLGADHAEHLFLVGIFSLLDVLLKIPLACALSDLNLPQAVEAALLHDSGPYAPYLWLAIACEAGDRPELSAIAEECGIQPDDVNRLHLDAMLWAQELESE